MGGYLLACCNGFDDSEGDDSPVAKQFNIVITVVLWQITVVYYFVTASRKYGNSR